MMNNYKITNTSQIPLILCVCSGIGRSAIMEARLHSLLVQHGLSERIRVASAGIQGTGGTTRPKFDNLISYPEGSIMLPLLQERGIDISRHHYRPVTLELVAEATVILVPAEEIRSIKPNALAVQFPQYHHKIMLLSELVGERTDVPDFGDCLDPAVHHQALDLICSYLDNGFDRLCKLLDVQLHVH